MRDIFKEYDNIKAEKRKFLIESDEKKNIIYNDIRDSLDCLIENKLTIYDLINIIKGVTDKKIKGIKLSKSEIRIELLSSDSVILTDIYYDFNNNKFNGHLGQDKIINALNVFIRKEINEAINLKK